MTFARKFSEWAERKAERRAANLRSLATVPAGRLHQGTYQGATNGPAEKSAAKRNGRLLQLAEMMPCLLVIPGCCNHRVDTTVACHSNQSIHGKAGARKADDMWTVWGCAACHAWLDTGPAPQKDKERAFLQAHARQVGFWHSIAAGTSFSAAERRAAQWALDQLQENT